MQWFHNVISAVREIFELSGRARVLCSLRQMDDEFLRQYGYAPEKIARGVAAWPWRADTAADVDAVSVPTTSTCAEPPAAVAQPAAAPAELERAA